MTTEPLPAAGEMPWELRLELETIRRKEARTMTTAKFRGYGVEFNGALQNVSFDESFGAEDWIKVFIQAHHLRGGVTIKIVRTNVVLAEDQS
jgi:hypothetical protein